MLTTSYLVWPAQQSSQVLAMNMALATGLHASEVAMEMGPQKQALFRSHLHLIISVGQESHRTSPGCSFLTRRPRKLSLERAEKTPGPQEMLAALLFRCPYLFLSSAHYLESPRLLALSTKCHVSREEPTKATCSS